MEHHLERWKEPEDVSPPILEASPAFMRGETISHNADVNQPLPTILNWGIKTVFINHRAAWIGQFQARFFASCFQETSTSEWAHMKVIYKMWSHFRTQRSLKRKEIKISSEWRDLKWEIFLFSSDRLVSMSEFQQPPTNSSLQNYCQDITNHVSCCQHSSLTPTHMMCIWIAVSLCCSSVPWFCIFYPFRSICAVLQHLACGFILRF